MISFAREALFDLVAEYGPEVGSDPERLEGLLRERCPECPQEIYVLVHAARLRIPGRLEPLSHTPPSPAFLPGLVRELVYSSGLGEPAATWGVQSWGLALGVLSEAPLSPSHPASSEEWTEIRPGSPLPSPRAGSVPSSRGLTPSSPAPLPLPGSSRRPPTWVLVLLGLLVVALGATLGTLLALRPSGDPGSGSQLAALTTVSVQASLDASITTTASSTTTTTHTSPTISVSTTRTTAPATTTTIELHFVEEPQVMACTSYGAKVDLPAGWAVEPPKCYTGWMGYRADSHGDEYVLCGNFPSGGHEDLMAGAKQQEQSVRGNHPEMVTTFLDYVDYKGTTGVRWEFTCIRDGIPTANVDLFFQPAPGLPDTAILYCHPLGAPPSLRQVLEDIVQSFRLP